MKRKFKSLRQKKKCSENKSEHSRFRELFEKFAQSVNGLSLHIGQDVTVCIHRNFD